MNFIKIGDCSSFCSSVCRLNVREVNVLQTSLISLTKGGYVFGSISLSVCLFLDITQKVINGFG